MGGKRWNFEHNPGRRILGCNGKYGSSGYKVHRRAGTPVCWSCTHSQRHEQRERRRGAKTTSRTLQPCGTHAAARRHRTKGESLDFACKLAEAASRQRWPNHGKLIPKIT